MSTSYMIPLPSGKRMKVFVTDATDKQKLVSEL